MIVSFALLAGSSAATASVAARAVPRDARAASRSPLSPAARHRRSEREALRRAIRRNPRTVLSRSFLRRANLADFNLPLTVRVKSGALDVTMLPSQRPLDAATYPVPAGVQTLSLAGAFGMQLDFGAGSGYGGLGNVQARVGQAVALTSPDVLRIAEFSDCGTGVSSPPAFLSTTPSTPIAMGAGDLTWADVNPFRATTDGTLSLTFNVRSTVHRTLNPGPATCTAPGDVADFDLPTASAATAWPTVVRLSWNGTFRIAPALTPAGGLRLGTMSIDALTLPEPQTTGDIWACAPQAALSGPTVPTGASCLERSAPLSPPMEPVGAAPFTAQFSIRTLTADVLLGALGP